jgi:hypothetical protein
MMTLCVANYAAKIIRVQPERKGAAQTNAWPGMNEPVMDLVAA